MFAAPAGSAPQFQRYGNHPYVEFWTGYEGYRNTDGMPQFWIKCRCRVCGARGDACKPCQHPENAGKWVWQYAVDHAHGLRPVGGSR